MHLSTIPLCLFIFIAPVSTQKKHATNYNIPLYNKFINHFHKSSHEEEKTKKSLFTQIKQNPITCLLFTINLIVYLISLFDYKNLSNKYRFDVRLVYNNPKKNLYRTVTYSFLHKTLFHLILNMITLLNIGSKVEHSYVKRYGTTGHLIYLLLYMTTIPLSLVPRLLKHHYKQHSYACVGASAGTCGLVASYIVINPREKHCGLPNWLFIPLSTFVSTYIIADKLLQYHVGHLGHIGGFLFGALFTLIFNPTLKKENKTATYRDYHNKKPYVTQSNNLFSK